MAMRLEGASALPSDSLAVRGLHPDFHLLSVRWAIQGDAPWPHFCVHSFDHRCAIEIQ